MLAYLLDENISFVGQEAGQFLRAATQEGLTLVTYDLKTVPPLLMELATEGETHAGVVFVDDATIRSNDFGGLVTALFAHWQRYGAEAWKDRIGYLIPSRKDGL